MKFANSEALQKRASNSLPLGVNSNFRYWGEGITPYVKKAKGAHLWDVDDNRYIDYRMAFGPIILGHAYPEVDQKVHEEIENGVLYAMTSELEIQVCEMIIALCPAVEKVRLACSGTEATMHAIRVARAYTGRDVIMKFEGMYHGFQDYTLFSTYSPVEEYGERHEHRSIPSSSGIPKVLKDLIITLPFNDFEVLDDTLRQRGHEIAAIICEPCMGNCAAIEPLPGFLQFIREKCTEYGIVFILDEVKTGFRLANGGAQEYFGIRPDMATYAKSLGNGYPIAAFGGKQAIMDNIGRGVAQGGTFNNNKPGVAAAYATLKILQSRNIINDINRRGQRLMAGLKEIFEESHIQVKMTGYPPMFSYIIGAEDIIDQRSWSAGDKQAYLKIVEGAIARGVMPDMDPREPWFLCYSHSDQDIDDTLNVMNDVVRFIYK